MKRKKYADKETFDQNLDRRQVVGVFKRPSNFMPFKVHIEKPKFNFEGKSLWLRHNSALVKAHSESFFPYEKDEGYER